MSETKMAVSEVAQEVIKERLVDLLFAREAASFGAETGPLTTYAVLDGASVTDLLDELYVGGERPEFVCLYRGDLEPDIAEVAPYLVRLEPKSAFTDWLLTNCWGKHFGIFVRSASGLDVVRRHFRKFLRVNGPEEKILYFRYYDPRVLKVYLPTCIGTEIQTLFGPIEYYLAEDENTGHAIIFTPESDRVLCKEYVLDEKTKGRP